jgi:hypothetical protein
MAEGKPISGLPQDNRPAETAVLPIAGFPFGAGSNRKVPLYNINTKYITITTDNFIVDLNFYGGDVVIICKTLGANMTVIFNNYLMNGRTITVVNYDVTGTVTTTGTLVGPVLANGEEFTAILHSNSLWHFYQGLDLSNVVFKDGTNAPFTGNIGVVSNEPDFQTNMLTTSDWFQIGKGGFLTGGNTTTSTKLMQNQYTTPTGPVRIDATKNASSISMNENDGIFAAVWEISDNVALEPTNFFLVFDDKSEIGGPLAINSEIGYGLDADWLDTDAALFQNRIGRYATLQTGKGILYDVWGSGFRTKSILGSQIDEDFNALPSSNSISWAVTESNGLIVGIGSEGTAATGHIARHNPADDTTTQIDISTWSDDFPNSALTLADDSAILMVDSSTSLNQGFAIWRSTDDGSTWTKVHTGAGAQAAGGITQHDDGRVVVTRYSSTGLAYPLYSDDGGLSWTLSSNGVEASPATSGSITVGEIHNVFMKHPDGTYMFAGKGTATDQYPKFHTAPTIGGTWTFIEYINGNTIGGQWSDCAFNDGATIYVGLGEVGANEYARIMRSTDKGVTWSMVYEEGPHTASSVLKILGTPDGVVYATIRGGTAYQTRVIRSVDNGVTWEIAADSATLTNDMTYSDKYKTIYLIRNNSADGKGFIVEELALQRDIGTGPNSTDVPVRTRMYNGSMEVTVAKEDAGSGDVVNWGDPELEVIRNQIKLLQDIAGYLEDSEAENGAIYREKWTGRLMEKDQQGFSRAMVEPNVFISAGAFVPQPSNVGQFVTVGIANGITGWYDGLQFFSTGTDYWHYTLQPPKGWSGKYRARASFVLAGNNNTGNVRISIGVRELPSGVTLQTPFFPVDAEVNVNASGASYWTTPWSDVADVATYSQIDQDDIEVRIDRDNTVGGNLSGELQLVGIEIDFV